MTFAGLVSQLLSIVNSLVPALFALTLVVVFWKVVKAWIIDAGEPQSVESGKKTLIVAVIALSVMVGVWGLVSILQSSLSLN